MITEMGGLGGHMGLFPTVPYVQVLSKKEVHTWGLGKCHTSPPSPPHFFGKMYTNVHQTTKMEKEKYGGELL